MNQESDEKGLVIWVVYDNPTDYPDLFVVRKWINEQPLEEVQTFQTLEEAREYIPDGLFRLPRLEVDAPVIVETWF